MIGMVVGYKRKNITNYILTQKTRKIHLTTSRLLVELMWMVRILVTKWFLL